MLFELHRLFRALHESKKERGAFSHRKFMRAIKKSNVLFDNDEHHDSHEFINWLLDSVHESFVKHSQSDRPGEQNMPTIVSSLFRGEL